jgi:hypothetical protein
MTRKLICNSIKIGGVIELVGKVKTDLGHVGEEATNKKMDQFLG